MPEQSGVATILAAYGKTTTFAAAVWRPALLVAVVFLSFLAVTRIDPIPQPQSYHDFADQRPMAGIPNFMDVMTNLPFLVVGLLGVMLCYRYPPAIARTSWTVMFAAVSAVAAGSAWYHLAPSDSTLVWDRLPMAVGFMALFVALLSETINPKLERYLFVPLIVAGVASVFYWYASDDLRYYLWVQFIPLICISLVLALFHSPYTRQYFLLPALIFYVLAKVAEIYDGAIFDATHHFISGHSLKHLLAAVALLMIVLMFRLRRAVPV
ncbi:MAG: ceramidase domain-containing protein [Pseudomonadota bacterium]|nr:ceramidase domain-containing protein [Pseudomonadota bacterium]